MIIRQTNQQRQTQATDNEFGNSLRKGSLKIRPVGDEIVSYNNLIKQTNYEMSVDQEEDYLSVSGSARISTGSYHTYLFSSSSINSHYLYNYEFKEYENVSRTVNEKELPSGLIFNYLRGESVEEGYLRLNSYSIGGAIGYDEVKNLTTSTQINNESNLLFDKSRMKDGNYGPEIKTYTENYHRLYTDKHLKFEFDPPEEQWLMKQRNIFVLFNPVYHKDYYPHWISTEVNHTANDLELNSVKNAIMEGGLTKLLLSYVKNTTPQLVTFNDSEDLKVWDVLRWLDDQLIFEEKEDELYLTNRNEPGATIYSYLEFKFKKLMAKIKLVNLIMDHTPTFEDIVVYKSNCKSSIIGYKIEKMTSEDGEVLQTIYYEGTELKFLDTQLCYDKRYFYKVSELRIVIGANYEYKDFAFDDDEQKITFTFSSSPSVKIIEKECQLFAHRITTPPLFSPDVEVVNELTKKNVIKFLVSDHIRNTGTYYDKFETVTPIDQEYYEHAEEADYINSKGEAIYSHRSATGNFEVFRIDSKPQSYEDFADGFLGVFSDSDPEITDKGNSMTFTDYIKHEKVYYYMFRSLSHHGKAGKPSLVFQCELVQDADEVILKKSAFDLFDQKDSFDNTKEFRKFIQIMPSLRHVAFKNEVDWTEDARPLGINTDDEKDSLWDYGDDDNYFKIRIKSKKTGKKFDLNLRFKQIKNN